MACSGAMFTGLAMSALGGGLIGKGLSNLGKIVSAPMAGVGGIAGQMGAISSIANIASPLATVEAIASSVGGNPLLQISSAASGAFNSLGSDLTNGFGAITGSLAGDFSAISGTGVLDAISSHTDNLMGTFGANSIMQAVSSAESFSFMSGEMADVLQGTIGADFGSAFSALNNALPFGESLAGLDADLLDALDPGEIEGMLGGGQFSFGNFLGEALPNIESVVTNGMTNFVSDNQYIPGFAGDLINLGGSFNLNDIQNFGNPGQLVENLINAGAGEVTGIVDAFGDMGFDLEGNLGNLASAEFNDVLKEGLGLVNNPEMINIAQQVLGSNVPNLSSLADFTDLARVMPASFDGITPDNFSQLAGELANVSLGSLSTPKQFGDLLNAFDVPKSLDLIGNTAEFIDKDSIVAITDKFLGGTGANGRILVSDIMGSLGGVNFETPVNTYLASMNAMDDLGAFGTLNSYYNHLANGLAGNLTVTGDPSAPIYGSDYINDTVHSMNHEDLDSFVKTMADTIAGEVSNIANNPTWSGAFGTARSAIHQVQKKIYDEQIVHMPKVDMHLEFRNNASENVYGFAQGMLNRVLETDHVAMMKGLAKAAQTTGDKYGDYWEAFTSESINKNAVEPYSIEWMGEPKVELEV